MRFITLAALLGLSMAGFRGDMKKVGHFLKAHKGAIETGAGDALKIGAAIASHSEFVNVQGLIQDGVQTVQAATQKKKNVGQLIADGLHIIGDLTSGNNNNNSGASNTEELFDFSDALHDAGDVGGIVSTGVKIAGMFAEDSFINVNGLIQDGVQTVQAATQKKKNVGQLIQDGLHIIGDLTSGSGSNDNTEELFKWSSVLHDAGDVAGVVSTGVKVAGMFAEDSFVNVNGLIQDGVQTIQAATQKKKNVGQLIQDGLHIIGDLTSGNNNNSGSNDNNTEELFKWSNVLHDAGDVAGVVSTGVKVAGMIAA